MEYFVNCNTASINPYTIPLDKIRVEHLYRRLGFSASVQTVQDGVGMSADALVDQLINQALNTAPIAPPVWANWTNANYPADDDAARQLRREQRGEFRRAYGNALLDNNLLDRLSFFWSNHFVTELDIYDCNPFLYEYINCLQRNAIGNFKTFLSEIGLTSAMLFYLDGAFNNGNNPNENYAREYYELFSLGEGNGYTEEDIIETARAFTGYVERGEVGCTPVTFRVDRHDAGPKTILGQTGNWGYDDVMDILFNERPTEIAQFICQKLYEFFVHPDCEEDTSNAQTIIDGMAATFVANNFELAPVLSQLFKSEHFFDENALGVIIKSPFDLYFNFLKETNFTYNDDNVANMIDDAARIGQELFDPVDVAGWQRDRQWINTNFMIGRWLTMEEFALQYFNADQEQFRTLAIDATDAAGASGLTESDPEVVARAIIDKLTPKGLLEDSEYATAIGVFRERYEDSGTYADDPGNVSGISNWDISLELAPLQVLDLIIHLTRQPEFQLK